MIYEVAKCEVCKRCTQDGCTLEKHSGQWFCQSHLPRPTPVPSAP